MHHGVLNRLQIGIATLFLAAACSSQMTEAPARLKVPISPNFDTPTDAAALPAIWAREVSGQDESGAYYDMLLPASWNGRLVLVVHGLVDPALPVAPVGRTPAEDTAGAHGYAIAFSSFAENGWAVKDGAQKTHALRDLFTQAFGAPSHVYLYGQSMGSLIALKLAEAFPTQYDGVVAECGVIGGSFARFRYMLDTRLLFDYFYPGVLPGNALAVPNGLNLTTDVRAPAKAAMLANMDGARQLAQIAETPVPFANDQELEASIEDQLFRHAREINDIMARGHGEPPVDREDYTSATLNPAVIADINATVPRFSAGTYAAHYSEQYYEPDGDLRIPVLTLYTQRDPALPASLSELLYQSRVTAAGHADMFRRQQASVAYGHCTGKLPDRISALRALVSWAENAPAPW
jgi:pimeloyl-ACP methyl ester carboxylesterase